MSVHNFVSAVRAGAAGTAAGSSAFYTHQIEQSCRFDASASSRLSRTFGTPSSTTKFSMSFWMKVQDIPGYQQIFSQV